jgi:purine-binding chemotaxis protein CheW
MNEVLTFSLGRERYAVDAAQVTEVFKLTDFARVPGARPPLFALVVRRGEPLTILDIRDTLGLRATTLNDLTTVIALRDFGFLVDRVHEILPYYDEDIDETHVHGPLIRGMTRHAVLVLETDELLAINQGA